MNQFAHLCDTNHKRGMIALFGVYWLNSGASTFNLMPFLYPYIGSYFHYIDESITVKNTSIFATIFTIMEAILMCASIVIYSRIGFRKTFYLIIAAQFSFNIIASWCTNFYLFCLMFSFSNAFASGGFMYVSMYCVW